MRSSLIAAAAFASSLVLANPLAKRAIVTEVEVVTVYVTLTVDDPEPTPVAAAPIDAPQEEAPPAPEEVSAPEQNYYPVEVPAEEAPVQEEQPQAVVEIIQAPVEAPAEPVQQAPSVYPAEAPNGYASLVLDSHNVNRAKHGSNPLTWSSELADFALQAASTCNYGHNLEPGGGFYGQNIAAGADPNGVGDVISKNFYENELQFYNSFWNGEPDMGNFHAWGHLTQVIWKGTTECACVTHDCEGRLTGTDPNYRWFTVCNYRNPGNVAGQYAANLEPPIGFY